MSKIIITGATGLIGTRLSKELISRGHEVTIFTRNIDNGRAAIPNAACFVKWDYNSLEDWQVELNGKDAVIHLAGANISGKRWDDEYKKLIRESREVSTRNLVRGISHVENKPSVFISASAVGIYPDYGDTEITEETPAGDDFLAGVVKIWEAEALKAENFGLRAAMIRTGVVLSKDEGMLKKMLLPFKFFIGGSLGSGKQWLPWVHIEDVVAAYIFLLENENAKGAFNAASPNPVRMKQFSDQLGKVMSRPSFFKAPKSFLRAAVGEVADPITNSLKVFPKKLLENGFTFKFPELEPALRDLIKK
jgi:uncharacterized protein